MARRGRPGKGLEHVDGLEAEAQTKERLKWILRSLEDSCTVREAAQALGVSEARFRTLREQALAGALEALAPRAPGRPPAPKEDPEVVRLREENQALLFELQAAFARTEIALAMPHVLRERPPGEAREKKGSAPRRPAWFTDARTDTEGGSSA